MSTRNIFSYPIVINGKSVYWPTGKLAWSSDFPIDSMIEYTDKGDHFQLRMAWCTAHDTFDNCDCAKKFNSGTPEVVDDAKASEIPGKTAPIG